MTRRLLPLLLLLVACEPSYPEDHPCLALEPGTDVEASIRVTETGYNADALWGEVSLYSVPVTFDAPVVSLSASGRILDGVVELRILDAEGRSAIHFSLTGQGALGKGAVELPVGDESFAADSGTVALGEGRFEVRHSYACGFASAFLQNECPGDELFVEGGCADGVDGDCDGLTDCEDQDSCGWMPECQ